MRDRERCVVQWWLDGASYVDSQASITRMRERARDRDKGRSWSWRRESREGKFEGEQKGVKIAKVFDFFKYLRLKVDFFISFGHLKPDSPDRPKLAQTFKLF